MRKPILLLLLGSPLLAEEPTVSAIVSTVRYHPGGEPAAVGLRMLSRKDEPGWRALAALILELAAAEPEVSRKAAVALAEGPEPERLKIAAATYLQASDDSVRAILAVGLAYGYADHAPLLLRHLRENRPGAADLARILAPEILPEEELRRLLGVPAIAQIVYDALLGRGLTVRPDELAVWARSIALECIDPARCRDWAARDPTDFTVLLAVAAAIEEKDEDVRDGAHCLLLTVSGRKVPADADVWRSWIAGNRDRYEKPAPASPGEIGAAIVRGARFLKRDLGDDGRVLWARDPDGHHVIGSTALAVLALRAAEVPKDHPAIAKALETMLAFDKAGAPALRSIEHPDRETYVLSLLAMALCELDPERYRVPLEALRQRIVSGMQPNGAWGYRCLGPTEGDPGRWDNSCTQYAVLALRALAGRGFAVPRETWQGAAGHLERGAHAVGQWGYAAGDAGNRVAMTSAGIGSLAICLEALHGRDAARVIRERPALLLGRAYLGRLLMEAGIAGESSYALYGIERACILTATKAFRSKNRTYEWYTEGARHLVGSQGASGALRAAGDFYGDALDTAYAILFLARATQTVAGAESLAVVPVEIAKEKDVAEEPPSPPAPPLIPPPLPPDLLVEWESVPTRTGEAVIVGVVTPADAALTVGGKPAKADARGRFFVPITITRDGPVPLVARGKDGLEARREVTVAFDMQPPSVRLLGAPQRNVGKQILVFRADEPLRAVAVAGRVYPADGPVVRAAVEVGEGRRTFTWTATDRAGNESRGQMDLEAENRFLALDGGSALRIDMPEQPRELTLECWVRGEEPRKAGSILANTEESGFGLFWASGHYNYPHGLVRSGGVYTAAGANRPWKWGTWTHLAFVYDGASVRFFVNGKLHARVETQGSHAPSHRPLWVGAEPDGHGNPNDFFRGSVDEVRVSSVARYTEDFRPDRDFFRDGKTLVLLHFDLDTLADGVVLDDSGTCHHATPFGSPAIAADGRGPAASGVLAHARDEILGEMPPAVPVARTPVERKAEEAGVLAEAGRRLGLVATTVRVQTALGAAMPGLAVRALHEALDMTSDPAVTDAQGEAVVRLPRGPWLVDLSSAEPAAGRVVFARARFAVRDEGRQVVVLDTRREVQLRTAKGELRTAHAMALAWPDFSFHRDVEALEGRLEIVTAGEPPMVVQAVRRPDERGGYILRRTIGPGRTILETEPEDATVHVFKGAGARRLDVAYASADALPVACAFAGNETREMLLSGMPEIVLHFASEQAGVAFRYYPRPFALDGKRVEFEGAPRFDASVGFIRNWRPQYGERANAISLRFLLRSSSGLLLHPDGPYSIAWQQVLDGKVRASGTAKPAEPVWTAPIDPKEVPKLRYRLQVKGPAVNTKLELEGIEQTSAVEAGKVRTWCFKGLEANARAWAACIDRAIRAYEETCPYRIRHVDVERSDHMPLPVIGMGGYGGDDGWMWLPGDSIYGFHGTWYWTGLLSHELGHVFRYGHSNPFENKVMVQAGRRAGRRLESIRPGMERLPEGNRYRALVEAATRGEILLEEEGEGPGGEGVPGDATGDGVLVPNLEITGDDPVLVWYYRSQFGEPAQELRRKYGAAWSWMLTLRGFSDEEIRIAMLSRAAGTPLSWLARMRGIDVRDRRIAEAFDLLGDAKDDVPWQERRDPILRRWAHEPLGADLAQAERQMRAELGDRRARVRALLRIAREHITRGDPAGAEEKIVAAMVEARLGGDGALDAALRDAAPLWVGR